MERTVDGGYATDEVAREPLVVHRGEEVLAELSTPLRLQKVGGHKHDGALARGPAQCLSKQREGNEGLPGTYLVAENHAAELVQPRPQRLGCGQLLPNH